MEPTIDPEKALEEWEKEEKKQTPDEAVKAQIAQREFPWKEGDRDFVIKLMECSLRTAMDSTGSIKDIFLAQANRLDAELQELDRRYPPKAAKAEDHAENYEITWKVTKRRVRKRKTVKKRRKR